MSGKRCSQPANSSSGMHESSNGVEAVVLERVVQVGAEIGIVVENGEIHLAGQGGRVGALLGRSFS